MFNQSNWIFKHLFGISKSFTSKLNSDQKIEQKILKNKKSKNFAFNQQSNLKILDIANVSDTIHE